MVKNGQSVVERPMFKTKNFRKPSYYLKYMIDDRKIQKNRYRPGKKVTN